MDVRLPDGRILSNVPEGTTKAQIMERLGMSQDPAIKKAAAVMGAPSEKELAAQYAGDFAPGGDISQMGTTMRALGGGKAAWDRGAMHLKGLFTDLSPEDKLQLAQAQAFQNQAGTAANVGAGVATAIPALAAGGAGTALLGAALPAAGLAGAGAVAAGTAGELGLGAAYGAATNEDRLEGAKEGAVGTLLGLGAGRLAGGIAKPFVKPEAEAAMAAGAQPTVGQALGGVWNKAEKLAGDYVPVLKSVIPNARARGLAEAKEALPGLYGKVKVPDATSQGLGEALRDSLLGGGLVGGLKGALAGAGTLAGAHAAYSRPAQKWLTQGLQSFLPEGSRETVSRLGSQLALALGRTSASDDGNPRLSAEQTAALVEALRKSKRGASGTLTAGDGAPTY